MSFTEKRTVIELIDQPDRALLYLMKAVDNRDYSNYTFEDLFSHFEHTKTGYNINSNGNVQLHRNRKYFCHFNPNHNWYQNIVIALMQLEQYFNHQLYKHWQLQRGDYTW